MKRTAWLILTLALGILLCPLGADAQQTRAVWRIGLLRSGSPPDPLAEVLRQSLRDLGYVDGQNIAFEVRYAEGKLDRFPDLATDLVRLKVDVIVTVSYPAALAAKQATTTIPIVAAGAGDPVGTGLVASLAHPGGNITGISDQATESSGKRLELLKEAVPKVSRIGVLWNSADQAMTLRFRQIQIAAQTLRVTLQPVGVQGAKDLENAFSVITRQRPDALFVISDPLTVLNRARIVEFAAKHRLPTMYELGAFVNDGGLMSYGPNFPGVIQRAAVFVDKILKGAKPGDLPVEQPTKFELVINLKTAKALGLRIPQSVLIRADEVIQ